MLIRISLIIAIIAGLAAGVLNFIKVKEKIDIVVTQRDTEKKDKETAQSDLATTKGTLAKTEKELTKTQENLVKSEQERAAAVTEAETQIKKSTELTEKLATTIRDRDDTKAELQAYQATGYKPEQIAALGKQIKQAQEDLEISLTEKKIIQRELEKAIAKWRSLTEDGYVVQLPPNLRGKILVADPKWEFVVLDVGEDQGALLDGELLVSRNGKLVGKVIIKDVQKNRCIANLVPGWKLADVSEGDQVIPAHPKS